jgi:hypothetical protein
MNMQEAVEKLERVDDLFGEISSNLVYICEELPSLTLPKETEDRIVGFCCAFLERLVEEDKSMQRILKGVRGNVDRVPRTHCSRPDGAAAAVETTTKGIWQNVQSMHGLIAEYQSLSGEQPRLKLLSALLNESGASILKAFGAIREELGALMNGWRDESLHD